ncbi:protein kintoun [Notolabrus celidotus]|uniref:protein kintoun n=1 Tax=Notolabrus celidotus TaxID=1203425 RepID=UPI00149049D9|nr:protein kintoun [Notolabrus celidotus]
MESGDKLKELNMTVDEIDRMTKALKDEKFREMLQDYAEELSDPANKKRYEEEISLLEQERGNTIEFIHPEPFRSIRTSVNGKQKCFINICSNDKVSKPECKSGVSEGGRRGQNWSLPHSLHPGREDTDTKGKKIMIYDVVFHPDTLHIARKDRRFMDMVESTAIEGIQKMFNVTLDKKNVREMSTKYKGTPQTCVIRNPIPGHKIKEVSEKLDPLAFPYPAEKQTSEQTGSQNKDTMRAKVFQIQPQKTKEPTKPNYSVKYRSVIDLQDFRCSRDSAQSPRPKEIVVTIDVPLLKAVADASLEVTETNLLLESKKPAYRLDLPLAYPVDEDKGEAKFSKQRGQLTVTLPVLPSREASDFVLGLLKSSVSNEELQERESKVEEEREIKRSDDDEEETVKEESAIKGERGEERIMEAEKSEDEENLQPGRTLSEDGCDGAAVNKCVDASPETENKPVLVSAEQSRSKVNKEEVNLKTPDIREETETTEETQERNKKMETDAALLQHSSSEDPQTAAAAVTSMPATHEPHKSSKVDASQAISFSSEELSTGSVETLDEDDLPKEGFLQKPEPRNSKATPALLREIDKDGNEKVISDHSTAAGFTFENTLMFELD